MYNESQKKATDKYRREHYATLMFQMKKDLKEEIRAAAEQAGESMNNYVKQAVIERMERERAEQQNS